MNNTPIVSLSWGLGLPLLDTAWHKAHQQHLLCVLSRAPTYRVNPTVSVPKCCTKTCCGNGHIIVDYYNSVFIGLPANQIARLQRVQNNAARLVMKKRRRDHVTPLLKELHWLPVKFRCQYKVANLAYRHFEGSLPPYLSSSLCTYEPSRSLRSSNEKLLKILKRNLKSFGQRSFSFIAL